MLLVCCLDILPSVFLKKAILVIGPDLIQIAEAWFTAQDIKIVARVLDNTHCDKKTLDILVLVQLCASTQQ